MTRHPTEGPGLGDFDAAVLGSIKRGATDPERIVGNLTKRHGEAWLVAALTELTQEIAVQRTRDLLRSYRLNAERKARHTAHREVAEESRKPVKDRIVRVAGENGGMDTSALADVPVHIPGKGMVLYGDCTADDLRLRGEMYARIAGRNSSRAVWCREVAEKIVAEQVGVLRDLSSLPVLPNGESPDEMGGDMAVTG